MSELSRFRDHCRTMAEPDAHRPDCVGWAEDRWGRMAVKPDPDCDGCVTPEQRDGWVRLADEADAQIARSIEPGLFEELA